MTEPPFSPEAERAVLGRMLADGHKSAGEVVGSLRSEDFYDAAHKALFERIVENYYADEPLDPLTVGQAIGPYLSNVWGIDQNEALVKVRMIANALPKGKVTDHARLVRQDSNRRSLLDLSDSIHVAVADRMNPEEVASMVSERAMRIATDDMLTHDLIDFGSLGRRAIREMEAQREAVAQGHQLGARFGLTFIDRFTRGLRPSELFIGAGEPGVGKSSVYWRAGINFAEQQAASLKRDPNHKQIGTLILSLEMGEEPSNLRIAQMLTGISGTLLRDARMTPKHMQTITNEWGRRKNLPLWFNFTSTLRESQLRALVVDAIRRHNIGLVIIDHFKHLHTDERYRNPIDAEESKAAFLKTAIAEDLNCAVVCLAHTTKAASDAPDKRPQLTNLRGSYQIAAIADFVSFIFRPILYATEAEKAGGGVTERDAEIIFRKNRHGVLGEYPFIFDGETMEIK